MSQPPPLSPSSTPGRLPILAIRSEVAFPRSVVRITLSRRENTTVIETREGSDPEVLAVPMLDPEAEISVERLAPIGTRCRVLDRSPLADGTQVAVLQGISRVRWREPLRLDGSLTALHEDVPEAGPLEPSVTAGPMDQSLQLVSRLIAFAPHLCQGQPQALFLYAGDPGSFADLVPSYVKLPFSASRRLLQERDPLRKLEVLNDHLRAQILLSQDLGPQPAARPGSNGRAARDGKEPIEAEVRSFEQRLESTGLPEEACKLVLHELAQLKHSAPGSPQTGRIRTWVEWMLELPWNRSAPEPGEADCDFARVAEFLDGSHVGLRDVKDRVAEFLAVRELEGEAQGTVLCFHGPPGTGKTSMARALATALGRRFVHISLGGITEEAELRGDHYGQVEAMPGVILQEVVRSGANNPVVLLDEMDKVQFGTTGEAGGPLLELLDSDYNCEFLDRYVGVPFDLSRCIFLATANDVEQVPEALLDRMEVIEFGSYAEAEKLLIARDHLLPRARANAGLEPWQFKLTRGAMLAVVRKYTEEAGVRQFQRQLDSLARKAALRVVRGGGAMAVRKAQLLDLLGPSIVDEELHVRRPRVGVTLGLSWTNAGGAMLPIEAVAMSGEGRTILTGSIGEVMRESVQTAISYVRGCLTELGLEANALESLDLHLHFPGAATPKDGPSAGIAVATSLVSLLTGIPVRHDVAMSGEMSLHGAVLPVGGLRDKVLAAQRLGIRSLILPLRNSEEVMRLPPDVRQRIQIHLIDHVQEALALALLVDRRSSWRDTFTSRNRVRRVARRASQGGSRSPQDGARRRRKSG